jgi:leader peptidase (prepilin peptidase)/N-methyltransferase
MGFSLLIVVAVLAGLVVGSFLTVVVDRVPQGGSVVTPPSRCGSCGLRLGPADLVPVLSWVALRGRCRRCGAPIGLEPLVIEMTTAFLFVLMVLRFEDQRAAIPAYWVLSATLVAQTRIDLRLHRLPREITFTGMALGAVALAVAALVLDEPERIWMSMLGAGIALALIGAVYLGSNAYYGKGVGFGFGDVILSPLLGMYLGWINPGIVPVGLFFGFLIGALAAVPVMLSKHGDRQTALPFGPFLALGAIVAIFVGQHFVDLVLAR